MQDKTSEMKQLCLERVQSGLTKDLESMYILAYAALSIVERLDKHAEETAKHAEDAQKKARAKQ